MFIYISIADLGYILGWVSVKGNAMWSKYAYWFAFFFFFFLFFFNFNKLMFRIGGSWPEFVDYVIASIKSEELKLVMEGHSNSDGNYYS